MEENALKNFDIRPFALPNTPPAEVRFEDPREVTRVVVTFRDDVPDGLGLSYLHKTWPRRRTETFPAAEEAMGFGWFQIDDWFNAKWKQAEVTVEKLDDRRAEITFKGLSTEFADAADFDVTYRRTLGVRVDVPDPAAVSKVEVYTRSEPAASSIRVVLDAGGKTPGKRVRLSGYNARIRKVTPVSGVEYQRGTLTLNPGGRREFTADLAHMTPAHLFSNDEGHVTFELDDDTFTISLASLAEEGPIWFEDKSVYITFASDSTSFERYRAGLEGRKTINELVTQSPEQSLGGAMNGQPRPHPVSYSVGCRNSWQRYWIESNGDILLPRNIDPNRFGGRDAERHRTKGDSRFFFGLESWRSMGRFPDAPPVLAYNIHALRDGIAVEQKTFAVPLLKGIDEGDLAGDESTVCLTRFRFANQGDSPTVAELPITYSHESRRSYNRFGGRHHGMDDYLVPLSERAKLSVSELADMRTLTSVFEGEPVMRCAVASEMDAVESGDAVVLRKELRPGESCEVVLKIPYIVTDRPEELKALAGLDFEKSLADVRRSWREQGRRGAQLKTPEPRLDALYTSHLSHVGITDFRMPDDPEIINTSVGTSTYGNYCNESCMIIEELEQRGLHDEARARLAVWLKYQGTEPLMGNFTDHDGVFFGCGGFEGGASYDQHHGWVLWWLAEHYFYTGDDAWLRSIAGQIVEGVDWVARQRKVTKTRLPHSRGWEYGWLAAGALEDVDDYFYWLSTNSLTWRGVEYAARALEAIDHPDAPRVRAEADDYRKCLIEGFEKSRQFSPLVKLRDGRWVPHYPSRLYRRGRDIGWIREILEGAVYLLISGLYDPNSKQGGWILDDFQDNRYMADIYGYPFYDPKHNWFDYGGFSSQPNLLAGLLPHLDRDEPEIYIWMFFNAWAACYREEIDAMVEHPSPTLGWSNSAHFKTSDQANAVKWLRYMFVYAPGDTIHIGQAIPRAWLAGGERISAEGVSTRFGDVSVIYQSAGDRITAAVELSLRDKPEKVLVRFRHPEKLSMKSVTVDGGKHTAFDPAKGDVDITGMTGKVTVEALY